MGPFTLLYDGKGALPAVSYTLTDPAASPFTLYDLSDRLRMRGWQVPSYPLPANRDDTVIQRVLVRHGVTRDQIALLVEDMRRAVEHLTATPPPAPATAPRSGFHH